MHQNRASLWDFPSTLLLLLILLTLSQRLYSTHWATGFGSAIILILIGFALGMTLGYSHFRRAAVLWISFGYSVPIVALVLSWVVYQENSWTVSAADLSNRLLYSLVLFAIGRAVTDTILFILFIALVFWIIGLIAGYAISRFRNFAGAVLPAGVLLVIIQLYDPLNKINDPFLAAYLFLCLLLLGRLVYSQRRHFWDEQRVALLAESRTELNISLLITAGILLMVVWLAPTSTDFITNTKKAWEKLTNPMHSVQENLGHAVTGLQGGVKKVPAIEFYGDVLPLGSQAATGDVPYFRIRIPSINGAQRYYWRVRAYNFFLNDQWYARNTTANLFTPNSLPVYLADREGVSSEFSFTPLAADMAVLVTPARPVWVSVPAQVVSVQDPKGGKDPLQFQPLSTVINGQQYLVHANVIKPTIQQLRKAGVAYPGWVTSNYLQLPGNLSPKIAALARQITGNEGTPFDQANAITEYLRNTITYTPTVEQPPSGQDPLEWFLFDSRKGFCNYYASAEVILLRSMGIPARLVVGFAQGKLESPDTYMIRRGDSHAWPEVYFPGVGWVEFEPTSSELPLERPLGADSGGATGTETPLDAESQRAIRQETPPTTGVDSTSTRSMVLENWLIRLLLILLISEVGLRITVTRTFENSLATLNITRRPLPVLIKDYLEKHARTPPGWLLRWAAQAELDRIERTFTTVYSSLHWLRQPSDPARTPAEAAALLAGFLPDALKEIESLLSEYQLHLYSRKIGSLARAQMAANVIRREANRVGIQQRLRAFRGIFRHGSGMDPHKLA